MMINVDRILIGLVISAPGIVVVIHFCSIKPILYVLLRRSVRDDEAAVGSRIRGLRARPGSCRKQETPSDAKSACGSPDSASRRI